MMILLSQLLPSITVLLTATALTASALASSSRLSSGSSLIIAIPASNILPNPHVLPPVTHATLTTFPYFSSSGDHYEQRPQQRGRGVAGNEEANSSPTKASQARSGSHILYAPITRSATFEFRDIFSLLESPPLSTGVVQSYLLEIRSKEYVFAPYRVDIDLQEREIVGVWESVRGSAWGLKGAEKYSSSSLPTSDQTRKVEQEQKVVIEARLLTRRGFYEVRQGFSPLSLLKNPMILIAVFALAVTFGMPKLMENMDPEMREEFEKQSRSGPLSGASRSALAATNPAAGVGGGFDLAGWMARASSASSTTATTSTIGHTSAGAAGDFRGGSMASGRDGGGGGSKRRG